MQNVISVMINDESGKLRFKIAGIYAVLFAANLAAWAWALIAFRDYPVLLGTALLAYTFGLRHAVDADHIAAIDNVTRKLMQEGKRPVARRLLLLARPFHHRGAGVGRHRRDGLALQTSDRRRPGRSAASSAPCVSALVPARHRHHEHRRSCRHLSDLPAGAARARPTATRTSTCCWPKRGLLARLFRPMFRMIARSWHMYPLGFLFGLGFDTATEVGLARASRPPRPRKGLPIWSILVFPALFTAGMSLIDTTDGILMLGAYGWAFVKPIRKLYYNMTITLVSVVVALVIGGIEALGLAQPVKLDLKGGFWDAIGAQRQFRHDRLSDHRHLHRELAHLRHCLSASRL